MNTIQKYIRKKRFEKYLKLTQEFGCIKQPKVYVVERDIKKLIADRGSIFPVYRKANGLI